MQYAKSTKDIIQFNSWAETLYDELEEIKEQMEEKEKEIIQLWNECEHNKDDNYWYIVSDTYDRNEGVTGAPMAMRISRKRTCLRCGKVETNDEKFTDDKKEINWK